MIKYLLSLFILFSALLASVSVQAQLKLPQASPEAFVKQTIGLTSISIQYHAPGVKGRKIFGNLVPYGQLWRAGANEATVITFEDDVYLNHERVPAGSYSFFILPENETDWNIVLNKDTTLWGLEGYNELNDVAYLRITPQTVDFQETMQFQFSDIGANAGKLHMVWENSRITLLIETEVEKKAIANIRSALKEADTDDWYIWAQSAEYMIPRKEYHEEALTWINKSITIKENFYNNWVKARLYAQHQEFEEAANLTAKAMQLGSTEPEAYKVYAKEIETAYSVWKKRRF
ncbi:DUF2911 domain-containing protein [Pontibacter beigongshangensis]|uniref:DUF2911 domain-containing protein n=1 Tax=Pontibacter beigongshangensis TaxID=2574733 RepID=UPI00164FE25C|nr:DUF2911 domain-containing protein [Pontibacter beigongshangensis]